MDWLPTIVEGIAGLELDKDKWALDGYNVWPTITANTATPRKEILINLDPPHPRFIGQAAIQSGDWKLITGLPNCSLHCMKKKEKEIRALMVGFTWTGQLNFLHTLRLLRGCLTLQLIQMRGTTLLTCTLKWWNV